MNDSERLAWRRLVEMGAQVIELGGLPALDLSSIRVRSRRDASAFVDAVLNVAGRSGTNRRHVDRAGHEVFVVSDDPEIAADVARWRKAIQGARAA